MGRQSSELPQQLTLRALVDAIVANDAESFTRLLTANLAREVFAKGADRPNPAPNFLPEIGHYIYEGDTALHMAAAARRPAMVAQLLAAGANPNAQNRRGSQPLHAVPDPESIAHLIAAGANPNAANKDGKTPLHRAIRARSAPAVAALLAHGARIDETAHSLAKHNTGRTGSGTPEAKSNQQQILRLLSE